MFTNVIYHTFTSYDLCQYCLFTFCFKLGHLIASEKEELLASIDENIAAVAEETKEALAENKPKKVEKLEEKKNTILARKAVVSKIQVIQHRLKHGDEILKLRTKVLPMMALEDKGR